MALERNTPPKKYETRCDQSIVELLFDQKPASRLSSFSAAASCSRSRGASWVWRPRNSQSSFAARPVLRILRNEGVRLRKVCRPFGGSALPLPTPADSSAATVTRIDCGRTPSARASMDTVAGPSRSSRRMTDFCELVKSPACTCSRARRINLESTTRNSPARAASSGDAGVSGDLLMARVVAYIQLDCTYDLYSFSVRSQAVVPGRCEASNPEPRDSGSGPSDHPGMTATKMQM